MKNKIILLLIILVASTPSVFAVQESKVISDGASKNMYLDSLYDANQYTGNLFSPHLVKEKKKKTYDNIEPSKSGTPLPVKRLRLQLQANYNNHKNGIKKGEKTTPVEEPAVAEKDQAILDCDFMEYFAPKTELHADGNVVMFFPQNNSTIKADKVVYNQTSNLIEAFGHVVLISDGNQVLGDFMRIDLNEENSVMDNPVSDVFQVHARAKKGYMYGDKLIQEQGNLLVTKKTKIDIKAETFGPDLDQMFVEEKDKGYFMKDSHGERFKIKTNDIIINSKKDHDLLTLKHAEIYYKEKKILTVPCITAHTDKSHNYMEADFPEFGTTTNLGMYAGPGFVFDTPGGTTTKIIPIINYQSNGDNSEDNALGWGAIAKFKSASNKTDIAYGTANKAFIMRGLQKLDDHLFLQYASNAYMDDWFMGFRMPKLMGELVYQDDFFNPDFLGRDKDMTYTHRVTGGVVQDGNPSGPLLDGEGAMGTARFKYMAEVAQTIYKYKDQSTSPINARLELVGQGNASVYGTGATQMIARFGPRIHSQYKYWMQDAGYFLSAYNDQTPLLFDRYMYGRSNVYLRESARLSKYLTLSWMGSLNLSQDSWDGKMIQENTFFFGIGPDDVKLNIGYDTIRQQTFVTMSMHLDAKGTNVEYKKMVIKNPDTLGKDRNAERDKRIFALSPEPIKDDEEPLVQKAEVIDIPTPAEAL